MRFFTDRGVTFVIEKALFERVKPVRIGYTHSTLGSGYTLESELMKDMKGVNVGCHDICDSCDCSDCVECGPKANDAVRRPGWAARPVR